MDIRFLESLIAVVETGSIAGAARMQYLTAAAVSQRIQSLESELNCELLSRSGHSAKPTETCLNLLPRARKLIRETEALKGDIDTSALTGTLKVGVISTALTGLLPQVLRKLITAAPQVVPKILPGTSKNIYDGLISESLDAAILVEPPFALPKSLKKKTIRKEQLLLISKTKEPLLPKDILSNKPYICYDSQSWGGKIAERYLADNNIFPETLCELDALETIQILVEKGLGASLVPNWSGFQEQNNRLTIHSIEDDRYYRKIVFITPQLPQHPNIIRVFTECLFS